MREQIKKTKLYKITEKIFIPGTYESFLLHDFLFLTNMGLTILMIIELILIFGFDIELHFFHTIDFIFGIIFMVESILRIFYYHILNKNYFEPHTIINWIVIISLIWPGLFWNLAFLRLIRSLKVIKVYLYKKERLEDDGGDNYNGIVKIIWIAHVHVYGFIFSKLKIKK